MVSRRRLGPFLLRLFPSRSLCRDSRSLCLLSLRRFSASGSSDFPDCSIRDDSEFRRGRRGADRSRDLGVLPSAKTSRLDGGPLGFLLRSSEGTLPLVEGLGGTFSGRRGGGLFPFDCDFDCDGGSSDRFS